MQAGWQPEGASRLLAAELCIAQQQPACHQAQGAAEPGERQAGSGSPRRYRRTCCLGVLVVGSIAIRLPRLADPRPVRSPEVAS